MSHPKAPHAIIIGGTSGTGAVVAAHFAKRGTTVSVVGRTVRKARESIHYFRADLEREEEVSEVIPEIVRHHGRWSSLLFLHRYRGASSWQGEWDITIEATRRLIDSSLKYAARNGSRSMVLFSSIASQFVAREQALGYHTAKAAVHQMARYYAVQLGSLGIRVNTLSPATILKPANKKKVEANTALMEAYAKHIPLGRMGLAKEMARAAYFLAGPDSSYITGHDLVVDGGLSLLAHEGLIRSLS